MKKYLFITNQIPDTNNGGNIRNFYLIKELSKYYDITLLTIPIERKGTFKEWEIKKYCEMIIAPLYIEDFLGKNIFLFFFYFTYAIWLKVLRNLMPNLKKDHNYHVFVLKESLKELLKNKKFDYIQVEHSFLGDVLKDIHDPSYKIIDFHNVHSQVTIPSLSFDMKYEKNLSKIYNTALCCSENEKKYLEGMNWENIIIVPNGVDIQYFKPDKKTDDVKNLIFIGDLKYQPNREGVKYFLDAFHPLLPENLKINILGSYRRKDFIKERKLKNVEFYGFVKDIRPFFNNSLFICPILKGGGTRIKILTSFASGVPVISTSKGAEGIIYKDGENILIANTPEKFAEKIKKLTYDRDLFRKISESARILVEEKYNWEKIVERYYFDLNSFIK